MQPCETPGCRSVPSGDITQPPPTPTKRKGRSQKTGRSKLSCSFVQDCTNGLIFLILQREFLDDKDPLTLSLAWNVCISPMLTCSKQAFPIPGPHKGALDLRGRGVRHTRPRRQAAPVRAASCREWSRDHGRLVTATNSQLPDQPPLPLPFLLSTSRVRIPAQASFHGWFGSSVFSM